MPYIYKRVHTKHRDFVTRTKCYYYNIPKNKKRRGVRSAPTPISKQKRNDHRAYLNRKYLIFNNFDVGDMWITLTWRADKLPSDPLTAHKIMTNTLSKIQKKLKRRDSVFNWFLTTEAGERVRVHHHLLIKNNFDVISVLYDYWKEYGRVKDFREIYNMEDGKLVKYILDDENHKELSFKKYTHSRNLEKPEVETRIYPAQSFRENPKPPKSDEDGMIWVIENLNNWYPDIDGYIYQEYELVKKEVRIE